MRNYFTNHSDKERRLIWFGAGDIPEPTAPETQEPNPDKKADTLDPSAKGLDAAIGKLLDAGAKLEGGEGPEDALSTEVNTAAETAAETAADTTSAGANEGADTAKGDKLKAGNASFEQRIKDFKEANGGKDPTLEDKQEMVVEINDDTPDDDVDFILNAEGTALEIDQLFEDKTRKAVVDAFREIADFIREIMEAIAEGLSGATGKGGLEGDEEDEEDEEDEKDEKDEKDDGGAEGLSEDAKNTPKEAIDALTADKTALETELQGMNVDGLDKEEDNQASEIVNKIIAINDKLTQLEGIIQARKEEVAKVWTAALDASDLEAGNHTVTGIACEDGNTLVVTLAEGAMKDSKTVTALTKAGFENGSGNTWTRNVPGPVFGQIAKGFQDPFNDLAKLPLKPTAKPKDDAEDGGDLDAETNKEDVEESPEKMAIALNAQLDTLRKSNSEFMSATPIGNVFTNMEYSVAADGENIMLKIDSGAAKQLRDIMEANDRTVTKNADGGYSIVGYPDGSTVDMPATGFANYPSRLAWGGEEGNAKSQFAQAKEGMEVWSSMVSEEPPANAEEVDAPANADIGLSENAESAGAVNMEKELASLKESLGKGVDETVFGKFIDSLSVKDAGDNIALTSTLDAKGFSHMYKVLEMSGSLAAPLETSGDAGYVMQFDESGADNMVYNLKRWAAFMGSGQEGGDFEGGGAEGGAEDDAGDGSPEEKGDAPKDDAEDGAGDAPPEEKEVLPKDYEKFLESFKDEVEDLKFHVQDETGAMDNLDDKGNVTKGSTLETILKRINDILGVEGVDPSIVAGRDVKRDIINRLNDSKLLDVFSASDADYLIIVDDDGVRVERVQPDAPEETEETADETPAETPEESPEITQEQLAQLTTQVSDNLDILVEALEQGEPSPETVVDIMNEQIRDSGLDLADDSVIGAIANADPGRIGIDGVDGNTYAIAYNPGDAENPISYSAQPERRSYEEIGPLVHAQFDKITDTLLNGYENGKDILVSAIAELNALNKEAGSDYNSEIKDQSFYDEPAGTEYKLVENSDNQYELQKEKEAAA